MLQMITGYFVSQSISVAARLGVADHLLCGPRSVDALAEAVGASPAGLYRLLRALASVGVFVETGDRTFGLTPLAECLQTGTPGSVRDLALMMGNPSHYRTWGELEQCIRTNEGAFEKVWNTDVFGFFARFPEEARDFNGAMTNISAMVGQAVATAYDFSGIRTLCDVGGGHGALLTTLLAANGHMQGVLFDLPEVIGSAPTGTERLESATGSFFESVPAGCDTYMMKHILHDWSDESCVKILKSIHREQAVGGKLLIIEMVVPAGNGPHFSKFADLNMLCLTPGGMERTEEQFRTLFASAGYRLERVVPTRAPACVIEATRI